MTVDQGFHLSKVQNWYDLTPQKDITVGEIAKILELLQIGISKSLYRSILDPNVAKHFTLCNQSKERKIVLGGREI